MKLFADLVESNGKTVRDNNFAQEHAIPIGTLVEVKYHTWHGEGACEKVHARLFVIGHTRDCDGTPLYTLGACKPSDDPNWVHPRDLRDRFTGRGLLAELHYRPRDHFSEEMLTAVAVTPEVKAGDDALRWPPDEKDLK